MELFIKKIREESDLEYIEKKGKNMYVTNRQHAIKITVISNSFKIITVDYIKNIK